MIRQSKMGNDGKCVQTDWATVPGVVSVTKAGGGKEQEMSAE